MARYSDEWPVPANWICIAIVLSRDLFASFRFSRLYNGKCHRVSRCYGWTTVERWFFINITDRFSPTAAYVRMEEQREMAVWTERQKIRGFEIRFANFCVLFYELRYVRRVSEIINEGLA